MSSRLDLTRLVRRSCEEAKRLGADFASPQHLAVALYRDDPEAFRRSYGNWTRERLEERAGGYGTSLHSPTLDLALADLIGGLIGETATTTDLKNAMRQVLAGSTSLGDDR